MEYKKLVHGVAELLDGLDLPMVDEGAKIVEYIIEKDGLSNEEMFERLPLKIKKEFLKLAMLDESVINGLTEEEKSLLRAEFRG